jgi:hypothetical protein
MKKLTLLMALFAMLGCSVPQQANSQNKKPESQATPSTGESAKAAEAMKGLRDRLFTSSAEEVGLSGKDAKAKVWGALMEVAFPEGVGTLVSIRDGSASLYTTTGGAVLGVTSAQAKQFVAEAEKHLARMEPAKSYPYPNVGRIKFYALTQEGVYAAEVDEKELVGGGHALSPLFTAANDVLTALRTASDQTKQSGKP